MLDIKRIRTDPDAVKAGVKRRGADMSGLIDELLEIDKQRRDVASRTDADKARQNQVSRSIPR